RPQVGYQVSHSGAKGIIVSGQSQADKVFDVLDQLPGLEFLISFDPIEAHSHHIRCLTWHELRQLADRTSLGEVIHRESAISESTLATIIYTSGTTGNPKGVMLTHGNLLHNAAATWEIAFMDGDETLLSWLPYSHIYARTVDHYLTTVGGLTVAMSTVDSLMDDLKTIQPGWLTSVPRVYEKVWNGVAGLDHDTRVERIRSIFGPNMKQLTSGGAPLARYIANGFLDAKLPLLEGYGLTEASPVIAFNSIESFRLGSVGKPLRDVEVRIADDGEILTRGPQVMPGYWKNPEATAQAIVDEWLHTGDVGHLDDDGFLYITDRKKDIFVTSAGKNIAPAELERLLGRDEFIEQAVVYGDGRQFVSAILVPAFDALQTKTSELGCEIQSADGLITTSAVLTFLSDRVAAVMEQVSQPERVKRFLVLDRPFQVDDGELTATLKVRRRFIIARYEQQLAALYD
ncbi:MAG: AMP-dependent synthetase/ligase, partial [Planctomycetaceae bacterium]